MKRVLSSVMLFVVLSGGEAAAQSGTQSSEEAAVRAAVNHYLQAHATGDGAHVRMVFHPRLTMMWVAGDTLATRSAEEYASGFRGQPQADEAQRRRRIERVTVAGTAAQAHVVLDYPNATFNDFFSLLKINGEWKIVSKVFSSQPKG